MVVVLEVSCKVGDGEDVFLEKGTGGLGRVGPCFFVGDGGMRGEPKGFDEFGAETA